MLQILYGGTFDPVHNGHLAVAEAAVAEFACDVALVPAADPPHRAAPGADASERAAMLELAIAGHPRLHVDRRELRRQGPSYTVDTLGEVRAAIGPGTPLAWLLGEDALAGLPQWHRWRELFNLAHLLVAVRPGYGSDALAAPLAQELAPRWCGSRDGLTRSPAGRVYRLMLPLRGESASAVRERRARAEHWQDLVPPPVAAYIRARHLYDRAGGA